MILKARPTRSRKAAGKPATGLRVLVVDDHPMMRDGIRLIVEAERDMRVVGEADNGRTGLELVDQLKPDVVLMDISMRGLNGIEATRAIMAARPRTKVVAVSMHCEKGYVLDMLEAGAVGYVAKADGCQDLIRAIRAVVAGLHYLSTHVAGFVIDRRQDPDTPSNRPSMSLLSPREREVLQLLAEGLSSKEIARVLNVSVRTVDTHRRGITNTLNLHSIAELTRFALQAGITPLET